MTAGAATLSGRFGGRARGAVVGFGAGLVAIAFGALLPDAVACVWRAPSPPGE